MRKLSESPMRTVSMPPEVKDEVVKRLLDLLERLLDKQASRRLSTGDWADARKLLAEARKRD